MSPRGSFNANIVCCCKLTGPRTEAKILCIVKPTVFENYVHDLYVDEQLCRAEFMGYRWCVASGKHVLLQESDARRQLGQVELTG